MKKGLSGSMEKIMKKRKKNPTDLVFVFQETAF